MGFAGSVARIATVTLSAGALVGALCGVASAATTVQIINSQVASHSLCLTPYGGGTARGTRLVQWSCNGDSSQNWHIVATDWGSLIVNNKSGRCMTPYGGSTADGAYLVLWDCDQHEVSQKWTDEGPLFNLNTYKAIVPYGGGSKDGTDLTLWRWNPNDYHQYWYPLS